MVSAIIVAAGSSRRMGFDKLTAPLAGKPVLAHSIAAFAVSEVIDEIILVTREERISELRELAVSERFPKIARIIVGGAERHLSVWNGLQAVDPRAEFVAIHDAARPLVTPGVIRETLARARKHGAASCAAPVADTLKRAVAKDSEMMVSDGVDRENLWAMQTPQIFSKAQIVAAYERVLANGEVVTDEVSAIQRAGGEVALLHNHDWNFKITLPNDLALAAQILSLRSESGH